MAIDLTGGFSTGPQKLKPLPAGLRARTVRTLFPVVTPEDDPVKFQPEPEEPEAGARWGRPGNFAFTVADADTGIPTGGGVIVDPGDQAPVTRYKFLSTGASVTRDLYAYKTVLCEEGTVKEKTYNTEYHIVRDLVFEFSETRPKPHIYNSNPIWKYDYSLHFLDRKARESEYMDECGNSSVDQVTKYVMQGNYENDTECAIRLRCTCEGLHAEDDQDECQPDGDGDPDKCIAAPVDSSGGSYTFNWIICGCHSISGDVEFWPPPLPAGWEERPCAQFVNTGDDFLGRTAYWNCVCCDPFSP